MAHALDIGDTVGAGGVNELAFTGFLTGIKGGDNGDRAVEAAAAHVTDGNGFSGGDVDALGAVTDLALHRA